MHTDNANIISYLNDGSILESSAQKLASILNKIWNVVNSLNDVVVLKIEQAYEVLVGIFDS
jgi:hypothetical protein